MKDIAASRFKIKILGMREQTTEINARNFITDRLQLTESVKNNMGIKQIFRIRRQPEATDRTVGPEICDFTSTSTAEAILNVVRGSGEGRHFKKHIPEPCAT